MRNSQISIAATLLLVSGGAAAQTPVDLELGLLVDSSGSITGSEFDQQITSFANAFRQQEVIETISNFPSGLAVGVGAFGSTFDLILDFDLLNDATSVANFANALEGTSRPFASSTSVNVGIEGITDALLSNGFDGPSVIDVSGDGVTNTQGGGIGQGANLTDTQAARDAAFMSGIDAINAVLLADTPSEPIAVLQAFYEDAVIGGINPLSGEEGFTLTTDQLDSFLATIGGKLRVEIGETALEDIEDIIPSDVVVNSVSENRART